MKRGVSTIIFIFLFALILMALIFAFGIKSFLDVKKTADTVELVTFIDQLDKKVQQYYSFGIGSSTEQTFSLPSQITLVCFADPEKPLTTTADSRLTFFLQNNKKDNVYVLPLDVFPEPPAPDFTIKHLIVDPFTNPLCISAQGKKLSLVLETVARDNNVFVQVKKL